jgi:hypothetical protein
MTRDGYWGGSSGNKEPFTHASFVVHAVQSDQEGALWHARLGHHQ